MAPHITSLSNHRIGAGDPLPRIFVYGTGFRDVVGVQIGDAWAESFIVDGETIITVTLPHLTAGTTNWIIVHAADGVSPCEGDAQLITVDDITDIPATALRLDSMEPPTIALGRSDTYWLLGSGLSRVTMAMISSSPCHVESYDDTRLVMTAPEHINGAADGVTLELSVFTPTESASLNVTFSAPVAPHEEGWPIITGVEPTHIGVGGGRITISGYRLDMVIVAAVGQVACQIESTSPTSVTAMVPSLEGYEHQSLIIGVADPYYQSPDTSTTITVDG